MKRTSSLIDWANNKPEFICLLVYKFTPKREVLLISNGFLRNSFKYGLGSLRKTIIENNPPTGPDPTNGKLSLILQFNPAQQIRSLNVQSASFLTDIQDYLQYKFLIYYSLPDYHIKLKLILKKSFNDRIDFFVCPCTLIVSAVYTHFLNKYSVSEWRIMDFIKIPASNQCHNWF